MPSSKDCPIIDACYLYNLLKELLKDLLGTYRYKNNYISPAIHISQPTEDIECKGLEVILPIMPQFISSEVTSTTKIERQKWKILLRDRDNGVVLKKALSELQKLTTQYSYIFFPISDTLEHQTLVFNLIIYQSLDI